MEKPGKNSHMMEDKKKLKLIVILFCSGAFLVISSVLCFIYLCCRQRGQSEDDEKAAAAAAAASVELKESVEENKESLVTFNGGEDLTIFDILDAAGEVIGKSNYGTLYKATFARSRGRSVRLLRFLRPACCGRTEELVSVIHILGRIRHNRLVPLQAFYAGPKGEKLLVHPFYAYGTLARFIRGNYSVLSLPSLVFCFRLCFF